MMLTLTAENQDVSTSCPHLTSPARVPQENLSLITAGGGGRGAGALERRVIMVFSSGKERLRRSLNVSALSYNNVINRSRLLYFLCAFHSHSKLTPR